MASAPSVLVTGASGTIGRFVLEELSARGHPVVAVDLKPQPNSTGVQWFQCDIRDVKSLVQVVEATGASRVIHLAGSLLEHETDVLAGVDANVGATTAVFELAKRCKFERVVFASSKAVFGPFNDPFGNPKYEAVTENHRRHPCTVYGLGKLLAEEIAAFYRRRFGIEIISVRFATTCGPGKGSGHGRAAILSHLVEEPARGRPVVLPEGGDQLDDVIYTADVASALVGICFARELKASSVNIGTGVLVSPRDVAECVRAVIPDAQISIGPGLDYMGNNMSIYCRMSTALAQQIGFRPRFRLADWVKDYIRRIQAEESSPDR